MVHINPNGIEIHIKKPIAFSYQKEERRNPHHRRWSTPCKHLGGFIQESREQHLSSPCDETIDNNDTRSGKFSNFVMLWVTRSQATMCGFSHQISSATKFFFGGFRVLSRGSFRRHHTTQVPCIPRNNLSISLAVFARFKVECKVGIPSSDQLAGKMGPFELLSEGERESTGGGGGSPKLATHSLPDSTRLTSPLVLPLNVKSDKHYIR